MEKAAGQPAGPGSAREAHGPGCESCSRLHTARPLQGPGFLVYPPSGLGFMGWEVVFVILFGHSRPKKLGVPPTLSPTMESQHLLFSQTPLQPGRGRVTYILLSRS